MLFSIVAAAAAAAAALQKMADYYLWVIYAEDGAFKPPHTNLDLTLEQTTLTTTH